MRVSLNLASTPFASPFGSRFVAAVCLSLSLSGAAVLTGCGMGPGGSGTASGNPITGGAHAITGGVHGGQAPVVGATVTIYVAGVNTPGATNGYGAGAVGLATTVSDANGNFNIPAGTYTCPAGNLPAYIVATGGNGGAGVNPAIAMMAALGTCPTGSNLYASIPVVNINEITTVSAVWALQNFMAAPSATNALAPQIGAPDTVYTNGLSGASAVSVQSGVQGMNNAFVTARVMADISTGVTPNPAYNAYATPESTKINTLADILAYCINSAPGSNCNSFLAAATPVGSQTALDTIQAAWYMAQNPIHNLPTLWAYISSTSPFQPYLGTPGGISATFFNDTTIAINYAPLSADTVRGNAFTNNLALAQASNVAIDAYGNAWFINRAQVATFAAQTADGSTCPTTGFACNSQGVSELGIDGSALVNQVATFNPITTAGKGANGLFSTIPAGGTQSYSAFQGDVAIDLANNAWVTAGAGLAPVAKVGGANYYAGVVGVHPGSTAAGVAGVGGVTTLTNSTGYFVGAQPNGIAIDGNNNVYMTFPAPATGASFPNFESLGVARMSATDGTGYTIVNASNGATLPAVGQSFLDIDTNTSLGTGGGLWSADYAACVVTGNLYSGTQSTTGNLTTYGLISEYNAAALTGTSGNEIATSASGATVGAGTSVPVATAPYGNTGNCGSTAAYVGQVAAVNFANPYALAVDANNGIWISDQYNASVKEGFDGLTYLVAPAASNGLVSSAYYLLNGVLPSSPTASTPTTGASGTSLTAPARLAVDGNNHVWVSNSNSNTVAEAAFNGSAITLLTPGQGTSSGFGTNALGKYGIGFIHNVATPTGIAIDASGNVWVANQNNNTTVTYKASNGLQIPVGFSTTVIVGAAAPVITPKALAVKYAKIGQKP